MNDYPGLIVPLHHTAPVPRRIRAILANATVVDSTGALYVWERPQYPQYYFPLADFRPGVLIDENHSLETRRGLAHIHGLAVGATQRPGCARVLDSSPVEGLNGMVHLDWTGPDSWFEEDEQVFVHPRDPYTRVDALRSTRRVRIALEGVILAESSSPVMVFETGLPTRYYLNRSDVNFDHLEPSELVTACPYKGTTSGYWSVRLGEQLYPDLAWAYDFPTRQLLPVAGLVAFYNEKVDVTIDGEALPRPITHFS